MIHEEDIIKIRRSQKDAYEKNDSHRNTHHTRQGGRTDHSTSSHGPDPSSTDRVMRLLRTWCIIVWGYSGIVLGRLTKEIKLIRDTLWNK